MEKTSSYHREIAAAIFLFAKKRKTGVLHMEGSVRDKEGTRATASPL